MLASYEEIHLQLGSIDRNDLNWLVNQFFCTIRFCKTISITYVGIVPEREAISKQLNLKEATSFL